MSKKVEAQLNYLRIAPRKVRALAEIIKGLDIDAARAQLRYATRRPAKPLEKLLNSAAANARSNFGLDPGYLYIKEIIVNEGMKLKRYKPKGFGMAMPIQKKTSHVKIVLDELPEAERKKKDEMLNKVKKFEAAKTDQVPEAKTEKAGKEEKAKIKSEFRPTVKKEEAKGKKKGVFGGVKSLGRRLFQRKSV